MSVSFNTDALTQLPLYQLVSAPFMAAAQAQAALCTTTVDFIKSIGLYQTNAQSNTLFPTSNTFPVQPAPMPQYSANMVTFTYEIPDTTTTGAAGSTATIIRQITVPLLAIINVPSLAITNATVNFSTTITSATSTNFDVASTFNWQVSGSENFWFTSMNYQMNGSLSTNYQSTSNNSIVSKYDFAITATNTIPDGLTKVLGFLVNAASDNATA